MPANAALRAGIRIPPLQRTAQTSYHHARRRCLERYSWIHFVRKPRRPCWSNAACQESNSSAVSSYRLQASSSEIKPPRTAVTTSALRRATQRLVSGSGRSVNVRRDPWGPMTYMAFERFCDGVGSLLDSEGFEKPSIESKKSDSAIRQTWEVLRIQTPPPSARIKRPNSPATSPVWPARADGRRDRGNRYFRRRAAIWCALQS